MLLILSFSVRHSLSNNAIEDLLMLLSALLPSGASVDMLKSYYKFEQHLPKSDNNNRYVFYCANEVCRSIVATDDSVCGSCSAPVIFDELKKTGNFFIMLSLETQISSILNVNGHLLRTDEPAGSNVPEPLLYRKVTALQDQRNISLTWNVDGVPLFTSSANEIWPIRCTINELPHVVSRKNVIMAGLYFGKGKPDMSSFMTAFSDCVTAVNQSGIEWIHPTTSENVVSKIYPIFCSCDAVARCMVQCIHQFNGAYGCSWCLQEGERVQKGAGQVNVYPLIRQQQRTHANLLECGRIIVAERDGKVTHNKGVKSVSPLFLLHDYGFDMVRGFTVDYMHCVLLGVVRQLIDLWTDAKYRDCDWHLSAAQVCIIDNALLSIKPPCDIKRFPRSIKLAGKWKASELRSFLLFYSMHVLRDILPDVFLKHWLLMVDAVYYLLRKNISSDDLNACELMLRKFVTDVVRLYGIEHMSYNVHQLSHLVDCVRNCGPLWKTSAFPFESHNQILLKLFCGSRFVPEQIAAKFMRLVLIQQLSATAVLCEKNLAAKATVQNCTDRWLNGYPLARSALYIDKTTVAIGNSLFRNLSCSERDLLQSFAPSFANKPCRFYQRVLIHGQSYCTEDYGRNLKTHSYSVLLKNKCLARIISFVVDPVTNKMCIFCRFYKKSGVQLLTHSVPVASHFFVVSLSDTLKAVEACEILSKIVFVGKVGNTDTYFTALQPNTIECD
jgi:hypothetical protein